MRLAAVVPARVPMAARLARSAAKHFESPPMRADDRGMMKLSLKLTFAVLLFAIAVVPAAPQSPSAPPKLTLANGMIGTYTSIQRNLLEAVELMPEADYLFKPTPETRPFGQLVS